MKFLYAFPFLLAAWEMFIFANESNKDDEIGGMVLYAALTALFTYLTIKRYKTYKDKKLDTANTIAINIGLLPLLYSNLLLTPITCCKAEESTNLGWFMYLC